MRTLLRSSVALFTMIAAGASHAAECNGSAKYVKAWVVDGQTHLLFRVSGEWASPAPLNEVALHGSFQFVVTWANKTSRRTQQSAEQFVNFAFTVKSINNAAIAPSLRGPFGQSVEHEMKLSGDAVQIQGVTLQNFSCGV